MILRATCGEVTPNDFIVGRAVVAAPLREAYLSQSVNEAIEAFGRGEIVIVTDDDVNVRDWKEVIWALTTRVDPRRDTLIAEGTPIDYLDFASPVAGLGSKMGIDATNKWPSETDRNWGTPIAMSDEVKARVDALWGSLGLDA